MEPQPHGDIFFSPIGELRICFITKTQKTEKTFNITYLYVNNTMHLKISLADCFWTASAICLKMH